MTVRAPTVVLAAGAMESPALLLRSGIGGPAVGKHLQLHPAWIVNGVYAEPVESWSGQIQSAVSFGMSHCEEDAGFLIESLTLSPALWAGAMSFADAADHRGQMRSWPTWRPGTASPTTTAAAASCSARTAKRWSSGRLDDPVDRGSPPAPTSRSPACTTTPAPRRSPPSTSPRAAGAAARTSTPTSRLLEATPPEEYTAYTAHQMSSCRLGADPATSVADGRGQLHDTPGVWVGDASALPTAPGVNPMITLMALADLTAGHILAT